jgi:hypothetical protein
MTFDGDAINLYLDRALAFADTVEGNYPTGDLVFPTVIGYRTVICERRSRLS